MGESLLRPVIVSIDDQHVDRIDAVVRQLEASGLQVSQIMTGIGIVAGTAPAELLGAMAQIEGVLAVEPDTDMHALDDPGGA